jgi:hypothetical protein
MNTVIKKSVFENTWQVTLAELRSKNCNPHSSSAVNVVGVSSLALMTCRATLAE